MTIFAVAALALGAASVAGGAVLNGPGWDQGTPGPSAPALTAQWTSIRRPVANGACAVGYVLLGIGLGLLAGHLANV